MGRFPSRGAQEVSGMRESHDSDAIATPTPTLYMDAYAYDDNDDEYSYKANSEYAFDR